MTPDTPLPDAAESLDDAALGRPIAELQDLSLEVDDRLRRRVRGSINRRLLAGELIGLAWTAPLTVLLEFLQAAIDLFNGKRRT